MSDPSVSDVLNSWLVMIRNDGTVSKSTFKSLTPGAVRANDQCEDRFTMQSPTDKAPTRPCGSQRPGINIAPAIAPDGTIYTISRSHFNDGYGYVVAATPNLKSKWIASLRGHLRDGCGVIVPIDGSFGGCIPGTRMESIQRMNGLQEEWSMLPHHLPLLPPMAASFMEPIPVITVFRA